LALITDVSWVWLHTPFLTHCIAFYDSRYRTYHQSFDCW
jgi:hypothetical protein